MSKMVVVTTKHRGVFYGQLDSEITPESVELINCRNCLRWGKANGFIGLAANGPGPGHRVGPAAPRITLHDITAVVECSDEAIKAWDAATW